jgi:hypothetical protein
MAGNFAKSGAPAGTPSDPNAYFVDTLFRSDRIAPGDNSASVFPEVGRIWANGLRHNQIPAADRLYLARLVAARTGISQADAEKRISDVMADAREMEDVSRRATAHVLLWLFLALLMGAFSASYAATIGGRQRDHVKAV